MTDCGAVIWSDGRGQEYINIGVARSRAYRTAYSHFRLVSIIKVTVKGMVDMHGYLT